MRPDGTFTQTVRSKETGEVTQSQGRWTFDPHDRCLDMGGSFMNVLNWPDELNPDYARPSSMTVLAPEYWYGRLYLNGMIDSWPPRKKVR